MAGRPRKQTVDYFSHFSNASDGRTLTILQDKFGNDGYSTWFRVLERLGLSEGHFYDCRNPEYWAFLVAKLHVSDISATEILGVLAKLGAIDPKLWASKVIWSQNFVEGLSEVYRKRGQTLPQKPNICDENTSTPVISGPENTQRIVKDSKGKERKEVYGAFQNVLLTVTEYQKLEERFNSSLKERIEKLSEGIASKGYKYASHYATILSWARRDGDGHKPTGNGQVNSRTLIPRTQYTRPEELRRGNGSHQSSSAGATTPVNEGDQL